MTEYYLSSWADFGKVIWGGKLRRGPRPKSPKIDARRADAGVGFLGSSQPYPHQLGGLGSAVSYIYSQLTMLLTFLHIVL